MIIYFSFPILILILIFFFLIYNFFLFFYLFRLKNFHNPPTNLSEHFFKHEDIKISQWKLYQNYPNPFNPTTVLSFDLPHDLTRARLEILDLKGRRVLADQMKYASVSNIRPNRMVGFLIIRIRFLWIVLIAA